MTATGPAVVGADLGLRVRSYAVPRLDGLTAYRLLCDRYGQDQVFLLESPAGGPVDRRTTTFGFLPRLGLTVRRDGVEIVGPSGHRPEPDEDVWTSIRRWRAAIEHGPHRNGDEPPVLLTVLGYDAARRIESLPHRIPERDDAPDLSFRLFQVVVEIPEDDGEARLWLHDGPDWPAVDVEDVAELLDAARRSPPAAGDGPPPVAAPDRVDDECTRSTFEAGVRTALEHVAAGDIYQVQLGHEIAVRSSARPWDVYRRLRWRNPSPYMCCVPIEGSVLLGASPELFVRVEDGIITMRPVAGTASRPDGEDAEAAAADRLRSDEKESAEHRMLVDLCRNDIGRVCRPGTLEVPVDREVTRFSHVLHLTSTVQGRLDDGAADLLDVLAAAFPAGTMTGAPKIRAMEIIEDLEHSRRGIYAGAVGLIRGDRLNTALCIRSVLAGDGVFRIRASAGVVADSEPSREWDETIAKLGATYWAVTGEELR